MHLLPGSLSHGIPTIFSATDLLSGISLTPVVATSPLGVLSAGPGWGLLSPPGPNWSNGFPARPTGHLGFRPDQPNNWVSGPFNWSTGFQAQPTSQLGIRPDRDCSAGRTSMDPTGQNHLPGRFSWGRRDSAAAVRVWSEAMNSFRPTTQGEETKAAGGSVLHRDRGCSSHPKVQFQSVSARIRAPLDAGRTA